MGLGGGRRLRRDWPWQHRLREQLLANASVRTEMEEGLYPIAALAGNARARLHRTFEHVAKWHITTQDQLFAHLRVAWPDPSAPRVMVDLGCHAGHGVAKNMSDALLWLHHFNASGSAVLGVDAHEEFALDLQHRLHAPPFHAHSEPFTY